MRSTKGRALPGGEWIHGFRWGRVEGDVYGQGRKKVKGRTGTALLVLTLTVLSASVCGAAPVFYLGVGANPSGDLGFQGAMAGLGVFEEDFDAYGQDAVLTSFAAGPVTVSLSLPGLPAVDPSVFLGAYAGGGGQYGTVSGGALLTGRRFVGLDTAIDFSFSGAQVQGFGAWVFDNGSSSVDSFTLTVEDLLGTKWTSPVLDANPGSTAHTVEGFIGVSLASGIKSVRIQNASGSAAFEVDHVQVVVIPEPATVLLMGTGLACFAVRKRRRATR